MKKFKRILRSIFISPLIFLVASYIIFEEFLQNIIKPCLDYISACDILQRIEGCLKRRHPYTLFAIYVTKLATFSGIKFFSLYLISKSNSMGGPLLVGGEISSAFITVWYARVALPTLLTLSWFAHGYNRIISIKDYLISRLKSMIIYQYAERLIKEIKFKISAIRQQAKRTSILKAIYRFVRKEV